MGEKITERQIEYLGVVSARIRESGFPPSASDLAKKFNVSRAESYRVLKHLRINELVKWDDGDLNTMRLTKKGYRILGV